MNDPESTALPRMHAHGDVTSLLAGAVRWFRERTGIGREGSVRERIEEALEEAAVTDETLSIEERSLLKNLIHFGELTVGDIYVPRPDILAVPLDISPAELRTRIIEIGHTRIPVYRESLDAIAGFLHVKDLLPAITQESVHLADLLRPVLFVPPSMRILDLLMKMRVSGCHIAMVVDEFGGTDGLVTMEDLFEELVGEIQDEHDDGESQPLMRWLGETVIEADARLRIALLTEALGEPLTDTPESYEDIDTLGGLLFQTLGRVPVRGEIVPLKSTLKAEITAADPRRIRSVRLTRMMPPPSASS